MLWLTVILHFTSLNRLTEYVKENPVKAATVGILAAPFVASAGMYFAGFTAAGVAKGSLGAAFMKTYGGFIAKGAIISSMQSVGAAGFACKTYIACAVPAVGTFSEGACGYVANAGSGIVSWLSQGGASQDQRN